MNLEDPYTWLEQVESEESLNFAKAANAKCLEALGDPSGKTTYDRVLAVLESEDRIPYARRYGKNANGEDMVFNFWKDSKNPKGLWRKTTLEDYQSEKPKWEVVLDVDKLAEKDGISWVWKGPTRLPRSRDPMSEDGTRFTRAMLSLSRGGSDATHYKEFDLLDGDFVKDDPFIIPEAKTRASYRSRDVLSVGTDMGEGSLTDSGYPRQVRHWIRGTPLEDAPVVFEGEKTDVACGASISDERVHGGGIYEIQYRSMTFYTSKYWIRKVQYEHLLAPNDPARESIEEPGDFVELDIQDDASIDLLGNMLFITLRSDWQPVPDGPTYKIGSVIYTDPDAFIEKGCAGCEYKILFEPTERTAYEYFTCTKNYLILSTMDNVKSKLDFYKIEDGGRSIRKIGKESEPQIIAASASAMDATEDDQIWYTTSGYLQPTTLSRGDVSLVENDEDFVTGEVKSLPPQYDAAGLEVEQRFCKSKDGTEIPYFLIKKKGVEMNGKTPTLLYGYGGFEISLGPKYIASVGIS